jgi:hypothetical protein
LLDPAQKIIQVIEEQWRDENLTNAKKTRVEFTAAKTIIKPEKPYRVEAHRISGRITRLSGNLQLKRDVIQIDVFVKPFSNTPQAIKQALIDRWEIEKEVERIVEENRTKLDQILYLEERSTTHRDTLEQEPITLHTAIEVEATYTE